MVKSREVSNAFIIFEGRNFNWVVGRKYLDTGLVVSRIVVTDMTIKVYVKDDNEKEMLALEVFNAPFLVFHKVENKGEIYEQRIC
jgi:hypothetical protein